jgi:hypothetical protein
VFVHNSKIRAGQARGVFVLLAFVCLAPAFAYAQNPAKNWTYTIREGDTLISICRAYLRDPEAWRTVGKTNGIDDPERLRVGAELRIPFTMLRTFAGTAEAMWTRGDVHAFSADGAPVAVNAGTRLPIGSRIETGAQGAVLLRLVNGALLLVDERSRVVLDEMTVYSLTGTTRTRLRMDSGRIENRVVSPLNGASQYQIKTPVVTTAARGTEFRVSLDDQQRTAHTEVVHGRIEVAAGKEQRPLDAGFGLVASVGGHITAPTPLPAAPDLASLPARLERVPVQLSWPAQAAAQKYRVRLTGVDDGRTLIDDIVDAPKVQWQDVPDGSYRVSIRSIADTGFEGSDAESALVIHARPEPPLVSTPQHQARLHGGDVDFQWTRSDTASSYDVEIADEPTFARPIAVVTGYAQTQYRRALPPGVYFWRIASRPAAQAQATAERGPFGDPLSFTLRRYPDGREAQAEIGKKTLTLRWTAGRPGETAKFEFSRDRTFATHLLDQTTSALQVDVPRPEPGTYFVRVRSIDDEGVEGPFGPIQTIEVPPPRHRPWWPWVVIPAAVAGVLVGLR